MKYLLVLFGLGLIEAFRRFAIRGLLAAILVGGIASLSGGSFLAAFGYTLLAGVAFAALVVITDMNNLH